MKQTLQTLIITLSLVFFTACGGGSGGESGDATQTTAIDKFIAYAQSNGSAEAPTLQDYIDAGVGGVDESKVEELNQVIANLTQEEVDSTEEVQALANSVGVTVPEGTVATQCSISEGTPKTDTSLTVHVVCSNTNIQNATVTLKNTTKPVNYSQTQIDDFVGFTGLNANTSYTITLTVTTTTETLTQSVTVTTNQATTTVATSITHNGTTYGFVTSPYTGKVWLDRNLGAAQVCTSLADTACYGDYYQWGRNFDGHEDSASATTATLATDVNNVGNAFITGGGRYGPNDWTSTDSTGSQRSANWSKTDGSSVCPIGFRVPTATELQAETVDNGVTDSTTAFVNFLKLPLAGYRSSINGVIQNSLGILWTSSPVQIFLFDSGFASFGNDRPHNGFSVRCIKN